jgi:hypothetical protein
MLIQFELNSDVFVIQEDNTKYVQDVITKVSEIIKYRQIILSYFLV